MWEIQHETVIGAAHQLRYTAGEGERLHGHNWRIRAFVRANALDETGFVLDFAFLARTLRELVEPWEHVFLNEIPPWNEINPTAENLAKFVGESLQRLVGDDRVWVDRVVIGETDECIATYYMPRP
ncbi:MAG: 6-carboxytetrahydropterin synthase [Deltaproteobacteria bacterium]|nr:6-carboxytetrahydropterin synthase [Deltaproteobacteria bacterium]